MVDERCLARMGRRTGPERTTDLTQINLWIKKRQKLNTTRLANRAGKVNINMNITSRCLRASAQCRYLANDLVKNNAPLPFVMVAQRMAHELLDMCEDLQKWEDGADIEEIFDYSCGTKQEE